MRIVCVCGRIHEISGRATVICACGIEITAMPTYIADNGQEIKEIVFNGVPIQAEEFLEERHNRLQDGLTIPAKKEERECGTNDALHQMGYSVAKLYPDEREKDVDVSCEYLSWAEPDKRKYSICNHPKGPELTRLCKNIRSAGECPKEKVDP